MIKKLLFCVFGLSLFALSCNDGTNEPDVVLPDFENAVILDFGGLDGCGWIIQLEDKTNLEPINLSDFDIQPVNELEVEVDFTVLADRASICMVGQIIEINQINKR